MTNDRWGPGAGAHATDGPIGKVRGLAVPIGAVAGFSDGVRLSLTRDEVRDLTPVDLAAGEE